MAWSTLLARHPNQLIGRLRQQQAPTSMCWGVWTDGTTVRLTVAAPPPLADKVQTYFTYRAHSSPVSAVSCAFDVVASVDEEGDGYRDDGQVSSSVGLCVESRGMETAGAHRHSGVGHGCPFEREICCLWGGQWPGADGLRP